MSKSSKSTQPMNMEQLRDRAYEAEREVAGLRAEQSDAILARREFDPASIRAAEDLVTATNDAIRELECRLEEQGRAEESRLAAVTDQEKLEQALTDIKDAAKDRETAINNAETAARAFMTEYTLSENARGRLQRAVYGLTGQVPNGITKGDQERRISFSFAAILQEGLGVGNFGDLKLKPGLHEADQPWGAAERAVSVEIEVLLAKLNKAA